MSPSSVARSTVPALTLAVALLSSRASHAAPPQSPPRPSPHDRDRLVAAAACASLEPKRQDESQASREQRLRWAPMLPRVVLRAHAGEGGFRRVDDGALTIGETLTANRGVDLHLSWSLDELVYRDDELANARFQFERRSTSERLRGQCAETAAKWLRVRLDPVHEESDERAAYLALDILTGGELSRLDTARPSERSP